MAFKASYLIYFVVKLHYLCGFHEFLLENAPDPLPVFPLPANTNSFKTFAHFNPTLIYEHIYI